LFEQICTQWSPILSDVKELYLYVNADRDSWPPPGQQAPAQLLKALHVFDAVQKLTIGGDQLLIAVADALGTVTPERAAGVLPMLQTISTSNRDLPEVVDAMSRFLDARWETDHPVEME
jgi:hypothetical protein